MKYYAQFLRNGIGSEAGQLVQVLGDRGLIRLDGRLNFINMHQVAKETAIKRGETAYQLIGGMSLLNAAPIAGVVLI